MNKIQKTTRAIVDTIADIDRFQNDAHQFAMEQLKQDPNRALTEEDESAPWYDHYWDLVSGYQVAVCMELGQVFGNRVMYLDIAQ